MDQEIYLQIKTIVEGSHTVLDAIHLSNRLCHKYPEYKDTIMSYIYGAKYTENIDLKTKQSLLNSVFNDNNNNINFQHDKIKDEIFDKALIRIRNNKKYNNNININNNTLNDNKIITKKCPHCFHALNADNNTLYVICGYRNQTNGYDWQGCGKDWCFSCNKKLCKSWENDYLQLLSNRKHNNECCKKQAEKYGYNYDKEYCSCLNIRNNNMSYLFFNYKHE